MKRVEVHDEKFTKKSIKYVINTKNKQNVSKIKHTQIVFDYFQETIL